MYTDSANSAFSSDHPIYSSCFYLYSCELENASIGPSQCTTSADDLVPLFSLTSLYGNGSLWDYVNGCSLPRSVDSFTRSIVD